MQKLSFFIWLIFLCFIKANAQDCPRIFLRGDTLITDPAAKYQWFRDGQAIPGATHQWFLPQKGGSFSVEVSGTTANYAFDFPKTDQTITGRVIDENYQPLAGALIANGISSTKSDADGFFTLDNVILNNENAVVSITKDGYWKNVQHVHFFDPKKANLTAMLEPFRITNRFHSASSTTIAERGCFLTFPPNGINYEDGTPYYGRVHLALKRAFPNEDGFGFRMPGGDFAAIDAEGSEKILVSYGFLSAELRSESNMKLKLADEAEVTIEFNLPVEQVNQAPDSLPFWHFDEATALWRPEGILRKVGLRYVGTVKHFSSWNADVPQTRAEVRGRVVNCKNQVIALTPVTVGQKIVTAYTDGTYTTYVPAETEFNINASVDSIEVKPLTGMESREVEDLQGSAIVHAVGFVDTAGILSLRGHGIKIHSVDQGQTFHKPSDTTIVFKGEISAPSGGIAKDTADCPCNYNIYQQPKHIDCQIVDIGLIKYYSTDLDQAFRFDDGIVYKVEIFGGATWNRVNPEMVDKISAFLPCLQSLSLTYQDLPRLPESFGQIANLQELNLESNGFQSVPASLGQLNRLLRLSLNRNQITTVPATLGQLARLEELSLSNNQLTDLPTSFGQLSQLYRLDVSGNQLTGGPASLGQLTGLWELDMSRNRISTFPAFIPDLVELRKLYLRNNQMSILPASIQSLTKVATCNFSNNQLTALPAEIGKMESLQLLDVSTNQLTTLPTALNQLKNLTNLNVSANPFQTLPEILQELTWLNDLNLSVTQLSTLPDFISLIKDLSILNLSGNQLTVLPDAIGQLSNLANLNVASNRLTALTPSIGDLGNLNILDVSQNRLTTLPETIGQLKRLSTLNVSTNQLTSLPATLGDATVLQSLNLSTNQLTELPATLSNLSKLNFLDVSYNRLTKLPASFTVLTDLKTLNLSNNPLLIVPSEIEQMGGLSGLSINNCQLTELPAYLANLNNLQAIDISANNFGGTVPAVIEQMTTLSTLKLNSLGLTDAPEYIGSFTRLTTLGLENNQLTKLPDSYANLRGRLSTLYLQGNNFSPAERQKIRAWFPNTNIVF